MSTTEKPSADAGRGGEGTAGPICHSFGGDGNNGWAINVAGLTFDEAMVVMQALIDQMKARKQGRPAPELTDDPAGREALSREKAE